MGNDSLDSREDFYQDKIDIALTEKILKIINKSTGERSTDVKDIPSFENESIIDLSGSDFIWQYNLAEARRNLGKITDRINLDLFGTKNRENIILNREELEKIGLHLLPFISIGVLNGGSSSSYTDYLKNSSFNRKLYDYCISEFDIFRGKYNHSAKGATPAYLNPDNSHGASFMELKMRSTLLKIEKYRKEISKDIITYPMFQMTSHQTDEILSSEYKKYKKSIYIADLAEKTGTDITSVLTEVQPLIAAFTHSENGMPKSVYRNAYGEKDLMLPLPGGHGQNFMVLKDIYKKLLKNGKRFVYLGNVDNIGFNIDLCEVAILALAGRNAGFDFALKTPVDVKGGILVCDSKGRLNCADIGPAVSEEEVADAEKRGRKILFNCATGLFNLEYLVKNIDFIIKNLPLRVSDQDKDAGRYSQAEQITWEIISLLDNFYIFGVSKYNRFLASKLLIENMLISRPECCRRYFRENSDLNLNTVSKNLNNGLYDILSKEMDMIVDSGRWKPINR